MGVDEVMDALNAALEAGAWEAVADLSAQVYGLLVEAGEAELADLVQDLHWIANDALAHPLQVERVLAP